MPSENQELSFHSQECQMLFELSNELICITDRSGRIQKVNFAFERATGYSKEELFDQNLQALFHAKNFHHLGEIFNSKQSTDLEFQILCKNSSLRWVLWNMTPIPGRELLYHVARDITEIKNAHHLIAISEAKFQRVLNDGRVGYWEVSFLNGAATISDNIRDWMGLSKDFPLTNELFLELTHPEDRPILLEAQKIVVEKQKPYEIEFRTCHADGSYIWIQGTGHPIFDENRTVIGLMGVSINLTQQKILNQTLEAQRAKMINSSRLSAIGEMASSVAHEINNPLSIIFMNAEHIRNKAAQGTLTQETIETCVQKIEKTSLRISKIIRSLRSLSRESEFDPIESVSIKKILDDTLEICQQRFKNQGIQLSVEYPETNITFDTRPVQLSQVLLNLLNNAYDAVEGAQERWIEVRVDDCGDTVQMKVTDSGHGISSELQTKIFDPFFTTKKPNRGTGLGLSISKNIIRSLGGSIKINLESPRTQFIIKLPKKIGMPHNAKPSCKTSCSPPKASFTVRDLNFRPSC